MDIEKIKKKKLRVKRDGNLKQLAEVLKELGDLYFETGKLEDALEEYNEQLEICNALNDKLNSAVAHRMIGEVYVNLYNYEQALRHQNHYLEGAKKMKNLLEEQRAFATLGRTYFCLAESFNEEAEKKEEALLNAQTAYLKSISICNELETSSRLDITEREMITMRARLFLNLGLVLDTQKEHRQAIDLIQKSAELCEKHNLKEDFHRTQISLSGIYERQGDFESALKHLEAAAGSTDAPLKAEAQFTKAEIFMKMEKWNESRKILVSLYTNSNLPQNIKQQVEKSLRIVATIQRTERELSEEETTSNKLKLYETLGDATAAAHCFKKAIDYYRKMLQCAEESDKDQIGAALLSLAQTLKDVARYDEAIHYARRELQLCTDPREICRSALFLADLLIDNQESDQHIRETYTIALDNAKLTGDISLEACAVKNLLFYLKESKNINETEVFEERLSKLEETLNHTESEAESESNDIGKDICLDELSDVEDVLKSKEKNKVTKKRTKRSLPIKKNEKGETQLHLACINGNIESVEKLLRCGHPTNVRDHCGWTPLHEAANHGYIEIANLLLENGADINDPGGVLCQGVTPIHDAASCGNLSMILLLIDRGANLMLKTNDGFTVLDCLQQWRNRVDDLSTAEQMDYDEIHKKLCAVIPANTKKKRLSDSYSSARNKTQDKVDIDNTEEEISAKEDYKRTIANLRYRGNPVGSTSSHTPCITAPLLDIENTLVDDWLEDDMNYNDHTKDLAENVSAKAKRKSYDAHTDRDKHAKRQKVNEHNVTIEHEEFNTNSEESSGSDHIQIMPSKNDTDVTKKKHQVSLLSIGFTRNSSSRTPSPTNDVTSHLQSKEFHDILGIIMLNIIVEGKEFKTEVMVTNDADVLLQEIQTNIKKMFHNETGCDAKLDIKTMNGMTVNRDNILKILRTNENARSFKCDIVELEIPSIVERYGTISTTYKTVTREFVSKCLKSCENTSILRLKQEDIIKSELLCVLKALEYQRDMQILHLSGGELHEAGTIINDCLVKLQNLQELYLQGCDIDFKDLNKLEQLPSQLKLLDLSYNPLRSTSGEVLCRLLTPLKQLQTLNLRYCELNNFRFLSNIDSLVNLDISWNNLDEDNGVRSLLQRQLLALNLSNSISLDQMHIIREVLNNVNFSFTNLESLELAACNLSDTDIKNILSRASNLSKFVLSGNTDITVTSANMLLKHKPTIKYINITGCQRITTHPDSETVIDTPEACTFIANMIPEVCNSWLDLWRRRGTLSTLPHHLIIFKPFEEIKA